MSKADLIPSLVADLKPTVPEQDARELVLGLSAGAAGAALIVAGGLGVQHGVMGSAAAPFLMKAAYTLSIAALAFAAARRLARPGARRPAAAPLLIPVLALATFAVWTAAPAPLSGMRAAVFTSGWAHCLAFVTLSALPVFGGVILALRRQAPTRAHAAGAAAGLLAGAVGAAVYALACTEAAPAFVLAWYTLGIAAMTGAGALLGPRLLRW